jgi:hypothetical protein
VLQLAAVAASVVLFLSVPATFLRHAAGAILIQLLRMPPTPPPAFVHHAAGALLNWHPRMPPALC